jgi:hypothetical protein
MLLNLFQLQIIPASSLFEKLKKSLLVLPAVLCIHACGGGGASNKATTPEVPIFYPFSLTSTLTNKCGAKLPFVDVELFIQNQDWSVVDKLQPDENGVFSFSSASEFINYTLVAKNQQAGEVEGLDFVSFHQVKATTPAIYQAQHAVIIDNSNCECVMKNVSLTHTTINNIDKITSSANFSDVTFIDSRHTVFNNVEACRIVAGDWPLHSFSLLGEDNNNDIIGRGVFIEEYFGNETWEAFASEFSTAYYFEDKHQSFSNGQIINGNHHFVMNVDDSDMSVQIFSKHDIIELFRSEVEYIFEVRPNLNQYLRTSSKQIITSEIYGNSLMVEADPRVPDAFKNDKNINLIAIKSDGNYDFTSLADYPMAIVKIDFQSLNPIINSPMPVSWVTYGPIEGVVPIKVALLGYESLINEKTHFRIDSEIIKSVSSNTYNDYVSYFQNHENMAFESNLKSYQIIID